MNENTLRCLSDEMLVELKKTLKDETEKTIGTINKILEQRSKDV